MTSCTPRSQHEVTIRAEISRLRCVAGALVSTHPYRVAEGVDLQVVGASLIQSGRMP